MTTQSKLKALAAEMEEIATALDEQYVTLAGSGLPMNDLRWYAARIRAALRRAGIKGKGRKGK